MVNKDFYTLFLIAIGLASFLLLRPLYVVVMIALRFALFMTLSGALYWLLTHPPVFR